MTGSQVVVLGDANVDMLIRLPDRASGSHDLTHTAPQLHGGGTAANVSVALARLGVKVTLVGAVGDDGYGRWMLDELGREGVDVQGVYSVPDAFTPMVMALIEPDGERTVVVWPPEGGAHTQLQAENIDPGLLSSAVWLHTTGMCLRAAPARDAVLYAMELAREAGVTVSLDLNLRRECWGLKDATQRTFERAIELADVVFGNAEEEIMPIAGVDSAEEAARHLCGGKRTVIARQGDQGALVVTPQETFHVPAFQTNVVDTLGAGDAFDGGFIAACMAKANVKEATRWGNGVAALKIGQAGAQSLPSLEDLKQLLG
ncbi:carbohydrate kinase family protein [Candidatus Neomarinimicrobiota bacterium]